MNDIRILIANKYFLMNYAISCILQKIIGFEVHGSSEEDLLSEIGRLKPHLLFVEIEVVKTNSYELLSDVREKFPDLKIIVLLDIDNKEKVLKILQFQLEGYLLKKTSKEELINAAKSVYSGERYFSKEIRNFLIENMFELKSGSSVNNRGKLVSSREKEIIGLIVAGNNNREIADKLFISENTVSTHRRNIMRKLKVKNTPQLILRSLKNGLVTLKDY
ncbi:MAG: response regulator transcription factor [Ignavibacteria bacterium]|jgi:DNA-binding NarL/FixJ family response regulator